MSSGWMSTSVEGIAIIGMAGRFPGARNIDEFWQNLKDGVESIAFFTDEELVSAGIEPTVLSNPNYIKAKALLEDIELFDASFFGFNPREAAIMDPQQRIFLECAWEALEAAGYDPQTYAGRIGAYAGVGWDSYLLFNLSSNCELLESVAGYQTLIGNEKDFLTTRVSYQLNLKGPSIDVQTACSTSLVATNLACQSLLNYQCDIALAGGISISVPQKAGYFYQEGGILSPDGHCRAFDIKAQGTVAGNGVGIVVLKRLEDALADGDCIYAVIKGSAINNDGSVKVGYTAPSVDGQAEVIAEALALAGIEAETVSYIEAHGTGTALGDPIEIAALTQVFSLHTEKKGFCAIGSVKTNVGHLDAAAGVTSLIKTVLALKHKLIPPSLHFKQPNPQINFTNSPFYVNTTLSEWKTGKHPRRAGVSSFGIGGTNAHVILEEAPTVEVGDLGRTQKLLVFSAKTSSALETATANLSAHLKQHPDLNLADVAYTLQVGRKPFSHRRMLVCETIDDAVKALESLESQRVLTNFQEPGDPSVVFMFPGQGAQYVNMALELYQTEPIFREQVDSCAELLKPHLGLDLRHVLYPSEEQTKRSGQDARSTQLQQTGITQPALFVIEYALARLWMAWGVRPQAMIGHSIGEYVAACLAGVFSLEEALALVAVRGRLMQQLPGGAMLAVSLPQAQVQSFLSQELSLAASNGPNLCVVSGSTEAIADLQNYLTAQNVACRPLHTSHAFHSQMMNPIIGEFTEQVTRVNLKPPQIPFISSSTGTWITATQATDPSYWARHLRQTVLFSAGVQELLKAREQVLLEVGPGRTLSTLVKQHPVEEQAVLCSIRHPHDSESDVAFLLNTLGQLWLFGVQVNWSSFYAQEQRHRIPLPTYPFERQRYWIEPYKQAIPSDSRPAHHKKPDIADWFYVPIWKQAIAPQPIESKNLAEQNSCWLVFADTCGVGVQITKQLEQANQDVITVSVGKQFSKLSDREYTINPQQCDDYDALLKELRVLGKVPNAITHFWSVTPSDQTSLSIEDFETTQDLSFYSLLFLAQAIGNQNLTNSLQIAVVTNNLHDVTGEEQLCPEKATVLGPCKVIPQEYPNITCRSVDVVIPSSGTGLEQLIDQLIAELTTNSSDTMVAYRGKHRWVQTFDAVRLEAASVGNTRLRKEGVYLITGGLGGIGLVLAEHLAKTVQAKLILIGRSGFPERSACEQWLTTHDDQDTTSRKIQKVQALEEFGAEVQVISADVANLEQMQSAIAQTLEQFGQIHGVIHAAGIAGGGMIQIKTPEIAASVLEPKLKGTLVLEEVLKDINLDFFVLCSSLSSIMGEFGQVDYCAANAFLDGFAHRHASKSGSYTVSINWDAWQQVGMAVNTAVPDAIKQQRQESLKQGITSTEGVNVFSRLLCSGISQVLVSTQDLQAAFQQSNEFIKNHLHREINQVQLSQSIHSRNLQGKAYVAPRNEIEQKIADIWQELLGIEQVGINDNFFELGGHSLLAVQIVSRLREVFPVELPLLTLLSEAPTIAELASVIATRQPQIEELEDIGINTPKPHLGIHRRKDFNSLPLSYSQERLWILHQLQPDIPFYNEVNFFWLTGSLNVAALEQSFNEIIKRHEVLRSTFVTVEERPVQVIAIAHPFTLPVIDLSQGAENERETEARKFATQEAQQPFDLAQGPLFRIKLLHLSQEQHILLLTVHHIVCDGWSVGVFIQELAALYEAFCTGKPSPLPELPIQYADFAVWQRQWLQGDVLEAQLPYWKQQLSGTLPVLELPTTRPRTTVDTWQGATQSLLLSPALTQALKTLSQQEGVTLFMTLLAAFKTLLYRYTSTEDILVGSPIANRNRVELEGLIGLFLNTLVLRTDLSGNPSFQDLLQRVREVALGAYAHQDLPFEKLVEELQPERNLSQSPLFQVMFILQNSPRQALELPGLTIEPWEIDNEAAIFDLTLNLQETPKGLSVICEYNADWFDAETITRMLGHWQTLLEGIIANPQARLSDLPLLTQAEQHQLLVEWNCRVGNAHQLLSQVGTAHPTSDACVHQLFEAQSWKTPDAVAVVFENQQLTYRELNHRANQLAHYLQSVGVGPEILVGICMECCLEMVVGILGILKAGGAYVPLDPAYPQERLAFMLADAQVPVLLTQKRLLEILPEHSAKVVCLDTDWEVGAGKNPKSTIQNASNLAYVIYTSGSTNQPKGVMITHGSLVNAYFAWEKAYSLPTLATSHLQMASFSFDVFSGNLVRALCSGAKLVLCHRSLLLAPEKLYQLMRQEKVDCAEFVPAVLRNLIKYLEETEQSLEFMRLLIVGSDSWYVKEHQAIQRLLCPQTQLINSYGVTEATIDTTYFQPNSASLPVDKLVPIGCPFANNQVYVLDPYLAPVPIGVPGELYIGDAGIARGYHQRPALTAEKFIPHPYSNNLGARLYKTGDLVRYLPDGNIEYLGRIDHQVKIRGFRIELGEVEAVLDQHPAVQEVVVLAREDQPGNSGKAEMWFPPLRTFQDKRLVAYVVPAGESTPSISELRNFLKQKLPNHMVPSTFVILKSLPVTPNGKVDRRALPAPDTARPDLEATFVAPQNSVEETLVAIWSELLAVKQVGIYDNFFELGGDSILSIQAIARANEQGLRLTPKQLFQYQTIAELATVVDTTQAVQSEQDVVSGSLPLTPIQHWFFEQDLLEPYHWNQCMLLSVRQAVNSVLLEQAVQHLLVHHDALRLRFIQEAGGFRQVNASPDTTVPFSRFDLSMLSGAEQLALETAATELQASLNLSAGPLVRVALFDLGTQKPSRLLIVIHHLAVDGVSWRLLLEDLQTAYQQLSRNEAVQLPPKTTSFKQWSEKLMEYAQTAQVQQEQHYWLSQLQKQLPHLPIDYPGGTNTVACSRTVTVALSTSQTQALLQEVPSAYRTQINDVLLTALVQAFGQWTGKQSLLVDLEGHGREEIFDQVDLSRTVGWFTTVFPVLLELNSTADPGEALKTVKEQLRRIPNRGIGYGILHYLSHEQEISKQLRKLPSSEVSFNYLGQLDQSFSETSLFGLAQESSGSPYSLRGSRCYLFEIDGFIAGGQLQMVWTYSEALHQRATVENLAHSFGEKLRSLITHCQSHEAGGYTPSDFPLVQLSQDELDAVFGKVEFAGG